MLSFLRTPTVRFLKMHFEFAFYSFFLIHLELKRQIRPCTPEFPRKPYANSDQNRQSLCPFSNQNSTKTIPFGAAHTFKANIREYLPPPWRFLLTKLLGKTGIYSKWSALVAVSLPGSFFRLWFVSRG